MQNEYNDKFNFKFTPCKVPEGCLDYDDYDPCESSDDITEKDLAELLKAEKLKLLAEKENDWQKDQTETDPGQDQDKLGSSQLKYRDGLEDEQTAKKRPCRKLIKNPFFSNRLSFSSDLPPRPASPPPQYFPPVDESTSKDRINCQKRKKKCRSGRGKLIKDEEGEDDGKNVDDTLVICPDGNDDDCLEVDAKTDGDDGKGKQNDDDGKKRRCKKQTETDRKDRPPCRKKESEISITLQPRQIPCLQRDLPPTSPKDIVQQEPEIKIPCRCRKKNCLK